jgi:hypothetical protein
VPVKQATRSQNGQVTVETLRNRAGRYGLVVRSWRGVFWLHSAVTKRMIGPRAGMTAEELESFLESY